MKEHGKMVGFLLETLKYTVNQQYYQFFVSAFYIKQQGRVEVICYLTKLFLGKYFINSLNEVYILLPVINKCSSCNSRRERKVLEMSRVMRKPTFWFPTWSDTNQAVAKTKVLISFAEADLRLCFRICKTLVFS